MTPPLVYIISNGGFGPFRGGVMVPTMCARVGSPGAITIPDLERMAAGIKPQSPLP